MSELTDGVYRRLVALESTLDSATAARARVVTRVADDVAWVAGLNDVGSEELVQFDSGAWGMALELAPETTGVVCCRVPWR